MAKLREVLAPRNGPPNGPAGLRVSTIRQGVTGINLIYARKSIAGSMIGGIAETQEVIDYCAARNIKADIELVRPD